MAFWPRRAKRESKIADGELVVVTGIVRAIGELLDAPLSGRASVAYASVAWIAARRMVQSYGNRKHSLTEVGDRRVVPFNLETRDRIIRIDASAVELAVAELPLVPRILERERAFLRRHATGNIDVRTSIFEERCVEPGTVVKIRGLAIAEADPTTGEHGFRDATSRFRIIAHASHPVTIRSAR